MEFLEFIKENMLIATPVIYIIGVFIKKAQFINDKYIPLILLAVGLLLGFLNCGLTVDAIEQGVLVAGAAVLVNQAIKQIGSK